MNQLSALHDLMPLLPELMLACGAMLMLMFGVIASASAARLWSTAGALSCWCWLASLSSGCRPART